MTILWMTSSSVEHFVIEDSQILTLEKLWMGLRVSYARAYAEPTRKSEPKMDFWKLGSVIFWKSVCFFNLPFFQLYESYNPVCMQNHCNPPRKNKSPRSETNNLEHQNKRLRETAYAASPTLSYAICLRRTAYAWMMLVPPQSKFHLEKKPWLNFGIPPYIYHKPYSYIRVMVTNYGY